MLKILSIAMSSLILFQSFHIGMDDLAKVDELFEHAKFHNETYGDNFFEFLSKHYGDDKTAHSEEHEEEKEEHDNLPFQHNTFLSSISIFVINVACVEVQNSLLTDGGENSFYYQLSEYSCDQSGVFQPPRLA